jgi:hypothetical protein
MVRMMSASSRQGVLVPLNEEQRSRPLVDRALFTACLHTQLAGVCHFSPCFHCLLSVSSSHMLLRSS